MKANYLVHDKLYAEAKSLGWSGWGGDARIAKERVWLDRLFSFDGVPQKGMISWQTKLTPSDMRDVGSFIMMFKGTTPKNPPAPKGPEGEEYIPENQNHTGEEPVEQPTDTLKVAMN